MEGFKRRQLLCCFVMIALLTVSLGGLWLPSSLSSAQHAQGATGLWQGKLVVPGGSLRIIFKITQKPDGTLAASIDSPDQGASGIPVQEVIAKGDSLILDVSVVAARFEGKLTNDSTLTGVWHQSGTALPLELTRTEEAPQIKRPQEPKPPYPYREEKVTFENKEDGTKLAGTLTLPDTTGQFPAVVLISGSGPQDRDETVFGHRPFLIIADHLTRKGIAVLRYDDRGVGGSSGDFSSATTEDFVGDALAAINYLKGRQEIDPRNIGLIGHSEGGLVAPLAATRSNDVAFIVLLAPPAIKGEDLLHIQAELIARANGVPEAAIQKNLALQDTVLKIAKQVKDVEKARAQIKEILQQALAEMTEEERNAIGLNSELIDKQVDEVLSPWFRYFISYDPRPALAKVRCPVLALYGEKDLQVPPLNNAPFLEEALISGGNEDVSVKVLPNLNHLFQTAESGSPSEYGTIEETVAPVALEVITKWILERLRR